MVTETPMLTTGPSSGGQPTMSAGQTTAEDRTVVTTGRSEYGDMLFNLDGQAIYLFEVERAGPPKCYDQCAVAWPPVLSIGSPQPVGGVKAKLLGLVARRDGNRQVTYGGWPLYYYAHEGPGEVKCHNIVLNGGRWLAMGSDGRPLPA